MTILRLPAIKARRGVGSNTSIYNEIREGLFPKPIKISERSSGWPEDEVEAINTARVAGATKEQIRELVARLHAKRAQKLAALLAT